MLLLRIPGLARFLLVASILRAATTAPVLDAIPVSEDYVLRTWEMDDGLPSNRIMGIARTPDGYLWLATLGGLTRFDGVRFTPFLKNATPGLETDRAFSVFVSQDAALWVGQERGAVARRMGDRFEIVVPAAPGPEPVNWITSFAQAADGGVWFGHEVPQKVGRWLDGQASSYAKEQGFPIGRGTVLCAAGDGKIWYANSEGCGVFDGKRFQPIDAQGGGWAHLALARGGGMWVTRERSLVHYRSDGSKEIVADLGELSTHTLFEDTSGNLWIGTNNAGLIRFRDGDFSRVPISGAAVSCVFEDGEGNLWVGTQASGLNRLRPRQFFLRQTKDGLVDDDTYSLAEDADGRLWLSGRNRMLVRATDPANRTFATVAGWTDRRGTMSVCPDPRGGVWLGTLGGLVHWQGGIWGDEFPRESVTALLLDRQKNLWVATIAGALVRRRDGKNDPMPTENGLFKARALAEDEEGCVWVGTDDGAVFRRTGEQFDRVPLRGAKPSEMIRFIVPDGKDTVWIGALSGGLYRWQGGRVERLARAAGFPFDDLRSLAITPAGDFWIGTGRGLFRARRSEIEAMVEGRQPLMEFRSYGRNDGLPSAEFALGFRRATAQTRDGRLWFATDRGALEVIPHDVQKEAALPPIVIEEVVAGGIVVASRAPPQVVLPPRPGLLQIRYTLPRLTRPEGIRFRYRLLGSGSDEWFSAANQRIAAFTRLPPGHYRFEVSAAEASGPWQRPAMASLAFTVGAAWWETAAFRVVAMTAGIAALILLVRKLVLLRVRARMRKLEQERALERERTRIARDIHDQLGANLTQIAITGKLLTLDPPGSVVAHSAEIVAIARQTVESLDEIVWAVNPANDTLRTLVNYLGQYAVNFLGAARIGCEVQIPENLPARPLPAAVRHHLFLAVKEALNNAAKHAGATLVQLKVELENTRVRVEISDNGRGFEPGKTKREADGLQNMQARMAELDGDCHVVSSADKGTRVIFELRLPAASSRPDVR